MPYLNGLQLVEALMGNQKTRRIPVILISTEDQKVKINEGMGLGAIDYITKPFDIHFLLQKVQNIINVISSQQADTDQSLATNGYVSPLHLAFTKRISQQLDKHYQDPNFSVTDLAKALAASERQLQRKCNNAFGYGPAKAIKIYRLNLARDYLMSGRSVTASAELAGFCTQSYFSRCFKEFYGITPKEYINSPSDIKTEFLAPKAV